MRNKTVRIRNLTRSAIPIIQARWCQDFFSRLIGFTFRSSLEKEEGLVLVEARDSRFDTSIHMFFVWTDLSVAWVNSDNEVVDNVLAKAWRPFYAPARPARYVIEFHPARHGDLRPGERISFEYD
ncbi:MAG: DUF192 domain-containing protein [Chloroflexi bacterium]|nr:DUF192 domain-containing protein [Chloroflexota bacterium]